MTQLMPQPQFTDVLDFWFGEQRDGFSSPATQQRWFESSATFDDEIRERFMGTFELARTNRLDEWLREPRGALAYIIVTDQFPRNLFRGSAEAFATDSLALAAARRLVSDEPTSLTFDERAFAYMPFEHSEALLDQFTSVGLFMTLRDDTPAGSRQQTGNSLRFAQVHRDIIRRFGRFPHRNAVLGRDSTDAERRYLEESDQDFGQSTEESRD